MTEKADTQQLLAELRARINEIDHRLVELMNERANVVVEVGKLKRDTGTPIYAPHREAEVLSRALTANRGPLPSRTIEGVFRELMSGSFALEKPLTIAYLGPQGSFSHAAAIAHFGSTVSFDAVWGIGGVFEEVRRGRVDYGLAPIENSTGGGISETLDAFFAARRDLSIYAEVLLQVRHHLIANCEPTQVRKIYSNPEVFSQCRNWLSVQYPMVELVPAASTSRAVQLAVDEQARDPNSGAAAIGSALAAHLYGANVLFEDIEDNPNNITRFLVLAREEALPSGDDKTSIMFTTKDEPGALVRVLGAFDASGVNLTHIDKRPSRRENWTYTFFIDAAGHKSEARLIAAMQLAEVHCQELIALGSYPRARRIL